MAADMPPGWEVREKPPTISCRFEFERYAEVRVFLDGLAVLSEATEIYPQNISFGSTYVNVTLEAAHGGAMTEAEYSLAAKINGLRKQ